MIKKTGPALTIAVFFFLGCIGNMQEVQRTMGETKISLYFHFGGLRIMNTAVNTVTEDVHYSVIIDGDTVFSFIVSPPKNQEELIRAKMADYTKIDLNSKSKYTMIILNNNTKEEIAKTIDVEKGIWIHFIYVIYPEHHDSKALEGIQINYHEAPQKYR